MIIACLIKRILHQTGEELIATLPSQEHPHNYTVIDKLLEKVPEAKDAKILLDAIIDLCGEPPIGTGLQNLRNCIHWTKEKYDAEPDHKKAFWKHMSVNFIERYFYLVCFATYLMMENQQQLNGLTFTQWMEERKELREMIQMGMAEFNWM